MGELVLLVVAAAWAAVLIPPLLRSRIENRPNSSVSDFRRQLNRLQSTVPSRANGSMRGMARPLAPSPLQRPAAAGRPGMHSAQLRRGGTRAHGARAATVTAQREPQPARTRQHGDPSGGMARPQQYRQHVGGHAGHRQARVARQQPAGNEMLRRRRSNMLFMLVALTGATLFLAATTKEPSMGYVFAASFIALCGYLYLLSQARQRETASWPSDWMQTR
jgi:hypothetical protein